MLRRAFLALFFSVFLYATAQAQIGTPTSIGTVSDPGGGVTNFDLTTTANVTGNLVILAITITNPTGRSLTATNLNGLGGTFAASKSVHDIGNGLFIDTEIWYWPNMTSTSGQVLRISYTSSSPNTYSVAAAYQIPGIATATPYDTAGATASGNNASPTVTTGTLAQAAEIVFGIFGEDHRSGATYTEASGFTNLVNETANAFSGLSVGYKIVAATTAVTHNPSLSTTAYWTEIAAPFKGAAISPSSPCTIAQTGAGKC